MFPEEDMLGIDMVIPDITYLLENKDKVRGIIVTHGHEDHIGALPFVLPKLNVPIYSTKLTNGLITVKLKERKLLADANLNIVTPGEQFSLGGFKIEFFAVNHSIPDAVGLIIQTPVGVVVHSGDFKVDYTPVNGKPTDLARLAQLANRGVLLLMSDSTYVEQTGYTGSEKVVGESLGRFFGEATGRVIVATFASHISRIQQVIDAAAVHDRKLFIIGHSMTNNIKMAAKLGYLNVPEGVLGKSWELTKLPLDKIIVITAGTQGEPTSTLVKMANRDQAQIKVIPGDTIIMSATPIPGNEALVNRTVDNLFRQGARVLYGQIADVHVHGHGGQEELKMMLAMTRPQFFVPIHGEYRHLALHSKLAESFGIAKENIFTLEDGQILELSTEVGRVAGKLPSGNVYVDGLGVGDIDHVILRDRWLLSQDGVVAVIVTIDKNTGKILENPDIVSRGFVDLDESEDMMQLAKEEVVKVLGRGANHAAELGFINTKIKETVGKFFYKQTKRRPMILPLAIEV
jgi:ribonuclease J